MKNCLLHSSGRSSNLKINLENINYTDLKDTSENSSYSFSVGTTLGINAQGQKVSSHWQDGTTTIGFSNAGQDKEGLTHSTIGQGEITVGGEKSQAGGINRDLSKTQIITKDEKSGGFNVNLNIDNSWIAGKKYIKTDENGNPILDENGKEIVEKKTTPLEEIKSNLS